MLGINELTDYQNHQQSTLRIAICPGIKNLLGLDFFMQFQQKHQDIHLKLDFQSDYKL